MCWASAAGRGTCPYMWYIPNVTLSSLIPACFLLLGLATSQPESKLRQVVSVLLEKTHSSFASCQLERAFWLGMEDHGHFPSQCQDPVRLALCTPRACCPRLCEFVRASAMLYLEGLNFLVSFIPIGSHTLSSLLQSSLSPERRKLMETFHLGLNAPKSLTLHTAQVWVSGFVPSTAEESFSDDG